MKPRIALLLAALLAALAILVSACGGNEPDLAALGTQAADTEPRAEITVVAEDIEYDTDTIVVTAGADLSITLDNRDSALHNIAVYDDSGDERQEVFRGDLFNGDDVRTYEFPAPAPGIYLFRCDAHPDMNGAFIAK